MSPPSGADAWLVDDRWSKAYPLGDTTTIGRGSECTIILRDKGVSRHHAEVNKQDDRYLLTAFGVSGTSVNGVAAESVRELQEGDVVEIAFATLRFTLNAPTGEMFVIPRDAPTPLDRQEGPTSVTVPTAIPVRGGIWRRRPFIVVVALILLALLGFFFARGSGAQ